MGTEGSVGEVASLRAQLQETRDQQMALGEILRVIARSPDDLQPVFDAVAENAVRFCGAEDALVMLRDGNDVRFAARFGSMDLVGATRYPLDRSRVSGVAMLERRTVHVPDVFATDEFPIYRERPTPQRTMLAAPMFDREGEAVGTVMLRRPGPRPFTPQQIELLETFASQAAIAIENVRLFNETKEALERQTATSRVLKAISDSTFDLQPMFDQMLSEAARLCHAEYGVLYQRGDLDRPGFIGTPVSYHNVPATVIEMNLKTIRRVRGAVDAAGVFPSDGPLPLGVQVQRAKATVHIPDVLADPPPVGASEAYRALDVRAVLGVPMRYKGNYSGAITLWKKAVGPFDESAIRLVESFADQAAIAIENVRLFNGTKEALDQQRAIADVLASIATATSDPQPVFDTILRRAVELCAADHAVLRRFDGDNAPVIASFGTHPDKPKVGSSSPADRITPGRRIVAGEDVVHIADISKEPPNEADGPLARAGTFPTRLGVAVRIEGRLYGWFNLVRETVRPFSEREIQLVRTFADQAAIAIENVRLFNETKEALDQQRAVAEVLKTISRSVFDLRPVLDAVVENAARLSGADTAWLAQIEDDGASYRTMARFGEAFSSETFRSWAGQGAARGAVFGERVIPLTQGSVMSVMLREARTLHLPDVTTDLELYSKSGITRNTGSRTVLAVPMIREGRRLGGFVVARREVRPFSEREIEIVETFADQAAIAIENVRLFSEIQDKSRQLEVASRHKSEFLANMSHELRTPLNAIIGFTDVMLQEMFGPLNDKQKEYLDDVRSSGTHLLSLINDILDLSKIEAGRMELEPSRFSLAQAIDNALTLVRERAGRHGISLASEIAPEIGDITADERKVKQVLVNLLSNAVKFTPDGGWVGITARREDGHVEIAVRDTGIGIAPEDRPKVFEEFQQVGKDPDRSREGTGLGLTLTRRFVELHGGRIWLESEVGKGSTFTFSLPLTQTAAASS